jgi:enoyl-CoA hydratase
MRVAPDPALVSVREERDGDTAVAVVTMAAPPANALSDELLHSLAAALDEVASLRPRAIVIESALPEYFAVGADIKLLATLDDSGFDAYLRRVTGVIERLPALRVPTIAAISGHAVGGGLELALACSLRIASDEVKLGLPEIKLGLLPGAGGTQRLPKLVGRTRAVDLLLSGRSVTAAEAQSFGFVDRVLPRDEVVAGALEDAFRLARLPGDAVEAILGCIDVSLGYGFPDGLAHEGREIRRLFATADAAEGIAAFVEKRKARFA